MRFVLPTIAAALALAFTAPIVAEQVSAQPGRPHVDPGDRDRGDRRRAEIEQLRAELGQYQQAYAELSAGLDRADAANRRNRDRASKTQIDRALREARNRAAQHVQPWSYDQQRPDWRDARDWRTQPAPTPAPTVRAMSDRDFRSLTDQVGRASFADDKLAVVQSAAQTNYFTVAQVVALMKLASFDDTRVDIAAACANRVIDGDKWFEVYGALSFSSSRDALRDRVGGR